MQVFGTPRQVFFHQGQNSRNNFALAGATAQHPAKGILHPGFLRVWSFAQQGDCRNHLAGCADTA